MRNLWFCLYLTHIYSQGCRGWTEGTASRKKAIPTWAKAFRSSRWSCGKPDWWLDSNCWGWNCKEIWQKTQWVSVTPSVTYCCWVNLAGCFVLCVLILLLLLFLSIIDGPVWTKSMFQKLVEKVFCDRDVNWGRIAMLVYTVGKIALKVSFAYNSLKKIQFLVQTRKFHMNLTSYLIKF